MNQRARLRNTPIWPSQAVLPSKMTDHHTLYPARESDHGGTRHCELLLTRKDAPNTTPLRDDPVLDSFHAAAGQVIRCADCRLWSKPDEYCTLTGESRSANSPACHDATTGKLIPRTPPPRRIQRRRTKGWRMHENTVTVKPEEEKHRELPKR